MAKRNLLLGNGINLSNNDFFSSKQIALRVEELLPLAFEYFGFQNNVRFIKDLEDNFDFKNYTRGVEELLYDCFKLVIDLHKESYFKTLKKDKFFELMALLKKVFINAIFIKGNKMILPDIPKNIIEEIQTYNKIFTLNYNEYWDSEQGIEYLHREINYQEFRRDDFGIDEKKLKYDIDYAFAIEILLNDFYYFPIRNLEDLLMLPTRFNIDKKEANKFQNEHRIDGFLITKSFENNEVKPLYDKFDELDNIDLFGVSPFGDEYLIEKLRNIDDVCIYIYRLEDNFSEVSQWKKNLSNAKLIDSRKFGSEQKND